MFKKALADLKTSAPLRGSDRKKLKLRVLQTYPAIEASDGDLLVPDGLQTRKFSTHSEAPGVAYLSPDGDPLWFTIGKGSEELLPTIYTLWKYPNILPFLSTPAPVVPKLIGGADLMIPGVVQHFPSLHKNQLVAVTQYHPGAVGPPLAVGRMTVSSDALRSAEDRNVKGKAVYILHTWKDALWEMGPGKKAEPPAPRETQTNDGAPLDHPDEEQAEAAGEGSQKAGDDAPLDATQGDTQDEPPQSTETTPAPNESESDAPEARPATPEEISEYLRAALLHAISKSLSGATFPMSASTFWSSYILPARPLYAMSIHGLSDASSLDIKHSTFKNVKSFLKAVAKEGIVKVKEAKGDIVVMAVYPQHPAVLSQQSHRTIGDAEAKMKKAGDREQKQKEVEEKRKGEFHVVELWKPLASTVPFFVAAEKDTSDLYSSTDVKETVNAYITAHSLINTNDQQYINVGADDALTRAVALQGQRETPEFLKRDQVLKRVFRNMEAWHEIGGEGRELLRKKGEMKPVSIIVKMRQSRKACTFITGYEPFGLVADELADELRKLCASATSVSPVQGKPNMLEVMVQGKQIKAVTNMLIARGVPERWIESSTLKK